MGVRGAGPRRTESGRPLGLSVFWGGLAAGINYSLAFVLVMLLHWTIATKQPAMTAPALAAKLRSLNAPGAID